MEQENKVAVVTGSAGGIGEATARMLAQRGYRVVVADMRDDAAIQACARLTQDRLEAVAIQVDVTAPDSVNALVQQTLALWGRIDVWVNNAGVESSSPFLDISLADYERVMRVNTTGVWICCQALVPVMQKQHSGSIMEPSDIISTRIWSKRIQYQPTRFTFAISLHKIYLYLLLWQHPLSSEQMAGAQSSLMNTP